MRLEEATAFLYSLNPKGIRFGLENTRLVLDKLSRPQDSFRVIHIAGSNGKGSTAAFLDAMLRKAGLRVGLFTSPHLTHFSERFRIDGKRAEEKDIAALTRTLIATGLEVDPQEVLSWLEEHDMVRRMGSKTWYHHRVEESPFCRLTFFECTTILACLLFQTAQVDYAIMETGMGGRLDATNVFTPEVSVITPIQLEHTAWLGDTIAAIAEEKAGIIKDLIPVVTTRQHPDAQAVIERVATEKHSPLFCLGRDFEHSGDFQHAQFQIQGQTIGPIALGLVGEHQVENASLALACLPILSDRVWPVKQHVLSGLTQVQWPGRFERFGVTGDWILDGAHNPDGIRALVKTTQRLIERKVQLVFGVLGDKDALEMLAHLKPLAKQIHLVQPSDARGRNPDELLTCLQNGQLHPSMESALSYIDQNPEHGPVLITGSLTIVGEAREWLVTRFGDTHL